MNQRIPAVLVPAMEHYLSSVHRRLSSFLGAFYVVGSIALDEFNPHFSDVDFVAVINHPVTKQEVDILRRIHIETDRQYPRWKLSGMYLLESQLGKYAGDVKSLIGFHDGNLRVQSNFELNPITWWILKNHGIPVLGSDPRDLAITVDAETLISWTQKNMNTYWKNWTRRPIRLLSLLTDWGVQWTVLGILRQVYTIREKNIITKQRAGEYGLYEVPERWHRIIKEAIRIRTKTAGPLYRSTFIRAMEVRDFINYIITTSNHYLHNPPQ